MAASPAHKFGQIIGNLLEEILLPILQKFCEERGLYLDTQGPRPGVRSGKKVSWEDKYGNVHDLDFVIEKGGAKERRGRPVAFIEAAWRRYTKHSRNKAQEIQGAILPIAEHHEWDKPFLGAVVAGIFTDGSLRQMKSVGFGVLYLPYETITDAFASVGINAQFDESTPEGEFSDCIKKIEALDKANHDVLRGTFLKANQNRLKEFLDNLGRQIDRCLKKILIIPLFGENIEFPTIEDAKEFIDKFDESKGDGTFEKYDVLAYFSNGDDIKASFSSKQKVHDFLNYLAL